MKNTIDLVKRLQSFGVSFRLAGPDDVRLILPDGFTLSDGDMAELKSSKSELVILLTPCPARCLDTWRCFGVPWFDGKPTTEKTMCDPGACRWRKQRERVMERGMARLADGRIKSVKMAITENYGLSS